MTNLAAWNQAWGTSRVLMHHPSPTLRLGAKNGAPGSSVSHTVVGSHRGVLVTASRPRTISRRDASGFGPKAGWRYAMDGGSMRAGGLLAGDIFVCTRDAALVAQLDRAPDF